MERNMYIKGAFALFAVLLLAGCGATGATPTPYPAEVDWETAVEILNNGDVEMVVQLHSLDVTLTMKDGSEIHTVEPTIDAIFAEIEKCGQPCSQIAIATE
jgi:ABC-type Zn uptake system ZnuABC Zn-binding protein ZnuA